jgi:protoheme IX farnesyltransferase
MGWTAVTGRLEPGGLALFLILFIWQMPHVIGLSVYRRSEYEKAGIRVLPLVHGPRAAQRHAIGWALLMLPAGWLPTAFGLGGPVYALLAGVLGAAYLGATLYALTRPNESVDRWGRRVFLVSLLYLPLLLTALVLARSA